MRAQNMENLSNIPDAELIRKYKNGEEKAFTVLLERYKDRLFTFILRLVGNKETAEDIFQETFIKVLNGLPNYREENKFSSWLFGIANNSCMDYFRKNKFKYLFYINSFSEEENLYDIEPTPDIKIDKFEVKKIIDEALSQLPAEQRQVLLLREHSELSFREIAEMLNCPLNTVLTRMRYALNKLNKIISKKYKGEITDVLQ
jgi:RNA polymerase sigma-70 factor (ECF subfamily)